MKGRPPSSRILQNARSRLSDSCLQDIRGLRPLCALHDLELNVFSLFQGLKSFSLQRGVMHEDIVSAVKTDEPKSLAIVKPFDRAFCLHKMLLSSMAVLSCTTAIGIQRATYMTRRKRQDTEQVGAIGSLERQYRSRNPSQWQLAQHVPCCFKYCQAILCLTLTDRNVDNPCPLTYSVILG